MRASVLPLLLAVAVVARWVPNAQAAYASGGVGSDTVAGSRLSKSKVLKLAAQQLAAMHRDFPPGTGQFPGRNTTADGRWSAVDRTDWVAGVRGPHAWPGAPAPAFSLANAGAGACVWLPHDAPARTVIAAT